MAVLEVRGLHGSLVHLIATTGSSQPPSPERHPRGGRGSLRWSGSFSGAAGTIPIPPHARELCPCGHRKQGHRASGELSLPCVGTKAAIVVGTQLGISCSLRAWMTCPVLGLLGVSQKLCFPEGQRAYGYNCSPKLCWSSSRKSHRIARPLLGQMDSLGVRLA